jgi:uncharacterized membrane protein
MAYDLYKFLHLLGVVLLIGNVTVTSVWKVFADRNGDPRVVAHAQRMVVGTDWSFTLGGILLLVAGGYGAAWEAGMDPLRDRWIVESEVLFVISGCIWLFVLVPIQARQSRAARAFAEGGEIPASYWRDGRLWILWGLVATVPLVAAMWRMIDRG